MRTKLTTEQFIERAKTVHGDKYDYSQVIYNGAHPKIKIVCPIHGEFEQTPTNHINHKQGCPLCGKELRTSTKETFITKANQVHGDKYDYSLVEYKNNYTPVKIVCRLHGEFEQKPNKHISQKQGCPVCADILRSQNAGWSRSNFKQKCDKNNNGLGILYVLECFNENERFIKIGITSRSIKERYYNKTLMPYAYSVIKEIVGNPEFIFDLETNLHKEHKEYKYIPLIPFAGHLTECFTHIQRINNIINNGDLNT